MELKVSIATRKHVEHRVQEDRGDDDPSEYDPELDLPGEQLKQAKREVQKDRAGQI